MALLARAKALEAAGRSIVHMEIGEPDFPTAAPIVAASIASLNVAETDTCVLASVAPFAGVVASTVGALLSAP